MVNVYLYGDQFNPKYSREFSQTIWPDDKTSQNQIADFEEITLASLAAAAATLAAEDEDDRSAFDQQFYSPIELAGIAAAIAAIEGPEDTDFILTEQGSGDMQWIASKPESVSIGAAAPPAETMIRSKEAELPSTGPTEEEES